MKKEQQILNKLAKYNEVQKVELSAEPMKVELGVLDNIKSASAKLEKGNDSIDGAHSKSIQKINTTLADSKSKIADAIDAFEIAMLKWEELSQPVLVETSNFERAAKELGMNPQDSPIYKEAQRILQDYDSYIKYYKSQLNDLNALYKSLKTSI